VRNAYRVLPYQGSTYRKSAAILAAFRHTIENLPKYARVNVIDFPEVGSRSASFQLSQTILFAGRLVPYKLPQLVVRAFADHLAQLSIASASD
jgi:glycosyltransferase involved in cell wall biosynthesis